MLLAALAMICHMLAVTSLRLTWTPYDEGTGSTGSDSWMGDTGEKPYLLAAAPLRGGDLPISDSPRDRPLLFPLTNGCRVHDESFELDRWWPWLWSCAWPLYSAYGERTAPCNCPFALISDRLCWWPRAGPLRGDELLLAGPFEYDEYCDCERSWLLWACDVGAMGSAYVDAINWGRRSCPALLRLDSVNDAVRRWAVSRPEWIVVAMLGVP